MSRLAEPNADFAAPERSAEDRWLEARGYTRCEHCGCGCTMRNLRIARIVWAWLSGLIEDPGLDRWDELVAVCLLDRLPVPVRGP